MAGANISFTSSGFTYDGTAKRPGVKVTVGSRTLTSGVDYTTAYSNNINAGTARVTITGKGNYKDSVTKTFSIGRASVKSAVVTLSQTVYTYNGQAKTPSAVVKVGGRTLTSGTDYTVSYSNHINPGTATAVVTGKGNYMDTTSRTFTIQASSSAPSASQPTDSGKAKQDISQASIKLSQQIYTYNMEEHTPQASVVLNGTTLTAGRDYTLAYANNRNAGTATVTAAGMGNYTGKKSTTFTILKLEQKFLDISSSCTLTEGDSMSLASARVLASIKSGSGTMTLVSEAAKTYRSSDASVVSVDSSGLVKALKAGNASVTITDPGNGNLYGVSFTMTVKVAKAASAGGQQSGGIRKTHIGSCELTVEKSSYTYTGKSLQPKVIVTYNGRTLTENTDYTVSYLNNVNAGQAVARVYGRGNYNGQADTTFTIRKKAQKITAKNITLVSSRKKQTKKLKVKVLGGAKVTFTPSIKKVKVSKGKVTIPANYVGACKIRIRAASTQNYAAGSKTLKVTVKPQAPKLTGLSLDSSKKALRISWKKVKGATGYEAQMALDGKFKKSVEKKKVKTAHAEFYYTTGKTYHFRVRTYKKVSGKLYYSRWSKVQHRKVG